MSQDANSNKPKKVRKGVAKNKQAKTGQLKKRGGNNQATASIFESAQAATVHPVNVQTNRNALINLVQNNFFGQNPPAVSDSES